MSFFGESEKDKKIRERADAAASKAKTLYPDLPQEEAGIQEQSMDARSVAADTLGQGSSLMEAAVMAANPKRVLSKMRGKMPVKDTGRLPQNPTRDTNKLRTKQSGGPDLDYKELNKLTPEDPNAPIIDYRNFRKR